MEEETAGRKAAILSTKELAKSLGLVSKWTSKKTRSAKKQPFDYLIVIDFESTCWKEKKMNYAPEIIEFPAVLISTSSGRVESEFHQYVMATEHPRLSQFCTNLTGISQEQVDAGIPIGACLVMFRRWLQELQKKKGVRFMSDALAVNAAENPPDAKWATFVTWSDWDIGICMKNECLRKRHRVPSKLQSWIDLKTTYKKFYSRKPDGLAGALKYVGITFAGREHSGLDDARNTAKLAWKMIRDGCVMNVTSSIEASVSFLHTVISNGFKKNTDVTRHKNGAQSNKTVTPSMETSRRISKLDHGECISNLEANRQLLASRESCGDKGKENSKADGVTNLIQPCVSVRDFKTIVHNVGAKPLLSPLTCIVSNTLAKVSAISSACSFAGNKSGRVARESDKNGLAKQSIVIGSVGDRMVAKENLSQESSKRRSLGLKRALPGNGNSTPLVSYKRPVGLAGVGISCTRTALASPSPVPMLASVCAGTRDFTAKSVTTPSSVRTNVASRCVTKSGTVTPITSYFTNASDPMLSRSCNASLPARSFNGGNTTPPLCNCGRRAKRLTVMKPGPNQGRVFYACASGKKRSSFGRTPAKCKKSAAGCEFFHWEPQGSRDFTRARSAPVPAAGRTKSFIGQGLLVKPPTFSSVK